MNWISKLEKTKKELEESINLEKRKLMMEREMITFKRSSLEKKISEIAGMEEELEGFKKEKEKISRIESEKLSKRRFLEDIKNRISKIQNSNHEIQSRGKYIDIKLELLENPEPFCPLCHKEMRYDQKVSIKNRLISQSGSEHEIVRRNIEQLEILQKKKEDCEAELKEFERKILGKSLISGKLPELQEKITEIRKEARGLIELEKREKEIKKILAEKIYAPMSQKLLKEINKEIKNSL